MTKANAKVYRRIFDAQLTKSRRELTKLKKKLTKKQLKTLDRFQTKEVNKMNKLVQSLGMKFVVTKTDQMSVNSAINYVKYKLLKMKKPVSTTSVSRSSSGDPYTCGPEYFNRGCSCNHYDY